MKGFAQGAQQEELLKQQRREARYYDRQWRDPQKLGMLQQAVGRDIAVPGGYLQRAMDTGEQVTDFQPRVRLKSAGG